ncbi:MAG: hypothetical protein HYR71_04600 [Chloroflexi bacterium]|nr:hypothetical protein [Chloroflexota bacterium]
MDQRAEFARQMLRTNGGCELPCWWGINPGQTTSQAVEEFFRLHAIPFGSNAESIGTSFLIPPTDDEKSYSLTLDFFVENKTVQFIRVHSRIVQELPDSSHRFSREWQSYAWYQIMSEYGMPTQVTLFFIPVIERNAFAAYELGLIHKTKGITITYTALAQVDAQSRVESACLNFAKVLDIW